MIGQDPHPETLIQRLGYYQHRVETHAGGSTHDRINWNALQRKAKWAGVDMSGLPEAVRKAEAACFQCHPLPTPLSPPNGRLRSLCDSLNWESDAPDPIKAYILACLCELTYLHITAFDRLDRYDFVGSELLYQALVTGRSYDVGAMYDGGGFDFNLLETEFFLFVITRFPDFTVIAVRGTTKAGDWLVNLDAQQLDNAAADYHPGFLHEAWKAEPKLVEKLCQIGAPARVYFTGHSLGGAVAAILATRWRLAQTPYVFASPRYGNEAARRRGMPHAYVRNSDPVPYLPLTSLGYVDPTTHPSKVGSDRRPRSLPRSLVGCLETGKPFASRHLIEGYRRLLGLDVRVGQDFPDLVYWDNLRRS